MKSQNSCLDTMKSHWMMNQIHKITILKQIQSLNRRRRKDNYTHCPEWTIKYTLFNSSRFSNSDCGSPTVKTYASKRTLLNEEECCIAGLTNETFISWSRSSIHCVPRAQVCKV